MPKRRFQSKACLEAERECRVLICIPAYNESACIADVIVAINEAAPENFDLLIIDDGSDDQTSEISRMKGAAVITHTFNMGYGAALKTAYKYATENNYDFIIQIDADGQHDVANIMPIYERLCADDHPAIVLGSRFLEGAEASMCHFIKRLLSLFSEC
jgi:glycosyltransferase involved in cell wall biosynthesis